MLFNYLKTGLRSLLKQKAISLINLTGLALGMACCLLIFLYVRGEYSYDRFHSQYDRIFRVLTIDEALGVSSNLVGITLPALGPALEADIPEVKETVRMIQSGRNLLTYGEHNLFSEDLWFAEPSLFTLFDFPLEQGEAGKVLQRPRTAVIGEDMARKLFGAEDPMGKTFTLDNDREIEVVGVMPKVKQPSHLEFDVVVSLLPAEADSNIAQVLQSWQQISMITYALLEAPAQEIQVEDKMEPLIRKHDVGDNFKVTLQPLADVHLGSGGILFDGYNAHKGERSYVRTLSIIALLVILIAAFNFMNLATARSSRRAAEVGVRKVLGAVRGQLIAQFLIESLLLCLLALLLALFITGLAGEWLELPFPENPVLMFLKDAGLLAGVIAATLALGILSGAYPAFMLSSFLPVQVLKGKIASGKRGIWLRRVLVVVQFTASIAMIAGTSIIYQQIHHLKTLDKGFSTEQVISLQLGEPQLRERIEPLVNELAQDPAIKATALSSSLPGEQLGRVGIRPEGAAEDDVWIVSAMNMDDHFISLMDMELIAGRTYSEDFSTDAQEALVINEALVRELGWETDPLSKTIQIGPPGTPPRKIIGVVKNFHFASMRHRIEPLVIFYNQGSAYTLSMKVATENLPRTLEHIASSWEKVNPGYPFEYRFFDQDFARQYENDERFGRLALGFTWLAILIACMGLFGLSAFMSEQRTKEISIRKILGASASHIIGLLSKEFALLVLVAALLASPLAYLGMQDWLEDFAYRVNIPLSVFILSGGLALLIALLTTSYHATKTARANPVDALRNE